MEHADLKAGRTRSGLTQALAAQRLGVSQPYLSQLERGDRRVTGRLARRAVALFGLPPTALPLPPNPSRAPTDPDRLARQVAGLGYPGFQHLRGLKANPAAVLLDMLRQPDVEVRLTETLPWLVLNHPEMDWDWLVSQAKLHNLQNRLGFVVAMAREVASSQDRYEPVVEALAGVEHQLERARLAREDTLCRESMPEAERRWLADSRSPLARHWNLLTGMTTDTLPDA